MENNKQELHNTAPVKPKKAGFFKRLYGLEDEEEQDLEFYLCSLFCCKMSNQAVLQILYFYLSLYFFTCAVFLGSLCRKSMSLHVEMER